MGGCEISVCVGSIVIKCSTPRLSHFPPLFSEYKRVNISYSREGYTHSSMGEDSLKAE